MKGAGGMGGHKLFATYSVVGVEKISCEKGVWDHENYGASN